MSFMKRFYGHSQSAADTPKKVQDNILALTHLKKLFTDFRHPNKKASQKEQEDKLYNMIPLFCKVFGEVQSCEMTEKFSDILQFCSHLSKLMVTEIRRRASNQSTEAASSAIVKFLEIESTEESSNGWMLLSALNLLSSGTQALIDCMTATSLPSTLVKCLYLFFDLREIENGESLESGCEFTPLERRILLQKVFVQLLVRLCHHSSPAEELARKDDLSLLFSAITSWCLPHNVMWRKSAAEVLMTLSRHGLTNNVTRYIHEKGCVRHCIENMQRIQELSPLELVEMFVTVFCFLKDSSEVSQTLLDDFRTCQGYIYLSEFLLRMEQDHSEEAVQALRNLVLLVGSLTTCGYVELKPSQASSGSLFQMPGFSVPQPVGKGVSVRNIQAFQVLQSVFLKASTSPLCSTILDVINSIYHQDNANYFILEPQHTLSQFTEKIHLKPTDVQEKFFELVEFIACDLNFVPCKELISISILIKTQHSVDCSIMCIKTLHKILQHHTLYKDVYREVGMLEVLVTCLHRYAALLIDPNADNDEPKLILDIYEVPANQKELGFLVMDVLSVLLSNNNPNAGVFRECGGARCAHNMVPFPDCRQQVLNIVQQLVLSPGGDDDMGTLLGLMHTATTQDLELKTHILKSLLNVLRESHRTRTVFRKVGGFVYVMSVLVSMEGCLADPPRSPWDTVNRQDVMSMLRTVFSTLTVAMRYEPANAKFFATEVRYESLTEAVRLLGCFSSTVDVQPQSDAVQIEEVTDIFDTFFTHLKGKKSEEVPTILASTCTMLKYLYNMALDIFDRPPVMADKVDSPSFKRFTMIRDEGLPVPASPKQKRASTGSIGGSPIAHTDQIIVHPGAVLSMFYLMPAIDCEENPKFALGLQTYIAELLKSMLYTERNQQIMCDAGFPQELLHHGYLALADELHPLHAVLRAIFERLASQSLTSKDLRNFLRLGSPLNCRPIDEIYDGRSVTSNAWSNNWPLSRASSVEERKTPTEVAQKLNTAGSVVPLTRVKCLVSMTTPRDARMHGSAVTPAFVEFDMSAEGFGCLYIPSIAPQGPPTPSVVSGVVGGGDPVVIGGIGTGERVFPPQAGMTYSTWFCVDKFGAQGEFHPVRLLTVVRNLQGRDENLICLAVYLNSRERSLIVSTEETPLPTSVTGTEPDKEPSINDNTVRFWYPELTQEGQWHHLVLIFSRAGIMKNSSVSLFVDGDHVNTQKLHYISPNLGGGGTASPTAFTSVFAYIGTPPQLRRLSKLTWRQGPCHLLEDIVTSNIISSIYGLGPTYVGSFQSPNLEDSDNTGAFVGEEKVVFGVHAHAVSQMTIAKIRKHYNKVDSKSIAKQLAMSAHENATPIRILHNSAGNLSGPARSLGAVLMGYLGVRTFCPRPVAKILENVGGASALLGLIAMATDVEGLYAAVKALVCVVKSNKATLKDMDRIRGYQTLAMLYKKKQHLLNSHILHLTFSLIGTVDSGRESSVIPNKQAFEDLLCDLEVWHEAPFDLQRSLYEHFYELLTESSEQTSNHQLMRDIGLVSRLLHIQQDQKLTQSSIQAICSVISVLIQSPPDHSGLLRLGQFIVSTLPPMSFVEKNISMDGVNKGSGSSLEESDSNGLCAQCRKKTLKSSTQQTQKDDEDVDIGQNKNITTVTESSLEEEPSIKRRRTQVQKQQTVDVLTDYDYCQSSECSQETDIHSQSSYTSYSHKSQLEGLNDYLSLCGSSPVKELKNPLCQSSDRTKQRYVTKAMQCVEILLETMCPKEGDVLWESMISTAGSKKNEDTSQRVLKEMYMNASTWQFRRQVLSILTQHMSLNEAQKFIPGLTSWKYYEAKKHCSEIGVGLPMPSLPLRRERVIPESLEHFIDFITSSHIIKDIPFGQRTLKMESGEVLEIPNVVRSLTSGSLINQYFQLCEEEDISPIGKSTLYKILSECPASVRKSLEGLDNYVMEGSRAFQTLEEILEEHKAVDLKAKLIEAKRYLKTDFKVHLDLKSEIHDHCMGFALSLSQKNFKLECDHLHTQRCTSCVEVDAVLAKVKDFVCSKDMSNKDSVLFKVEKAVNNIKDLQKHILRSKNQERTRPYIVEQMEDGDAIITADWAMKFLPRKYREGQMDWFAKRGINWHVSVTLLKTAIGFKSLTHIHLFAGQTPQDSAFTAAVLKDVVDDLRGTFTKLKRIHFFSDNAGCYKSTLSITTLRAEIGEQLATYNFCEAQNGKANNGEASTSYSIKLRNTCLELILGLLDAGNGTLNTQMCDEVLRVLGFDWLVLFMQGHIHKSSVIVALKILLVLFQNPLATEKFREGSSGGGWLSGTEPVLKQHVGVMLGLNIGTNSKGQKRELNREACQVPGFTALPWLLTKHTDVAEVYFLLMAILLGQNVKQLPAELQLNLDAVWTVIFGVPASKPVSIVAKEKHTQLCPDAALVILSMIRNMLNQEHEVAGSWIQEYPVTLMQFLLFLYHNQTDFVLLSTTPEFIASLASTLFPFNILDSDSNVTTPSEEFKPFPDSEAFVRVLTPEKLQCALLTGHPARKFVIDFLRTIVIDSFSQQSRSPAIIDIVLDASPDHATRAQRKEYQTEIMKTVMEHLLAADVLLGEQAALPIATGASYANMANNVFYFASRVVDKLWQGVFTRESKEVFDFISKLISQAKRKASGISLDLVYKSLNRTILFQLSRPIRNAAVQATVLDSLHKLTSNRSLVFGPGNYDQEFLVCLCYCLLQLTEDPEKSAATLHGGHAMTTTWHINIDEEGEDEQHEIEELITQSHFPEGHQMLANASKRVWEELYNCKKPALEEVFKTQLNSIDTSSSAKIIFPDLNTVRGLIQEYASKVWISYAESERKCSLSYAERIPAQIQSKLQKVGSGVLKLATRKNRKELPLKPSPSSNIHMTDYLSWTLSHMAVVKDLVQLQYQQYLQAHEYMEKYLVEEWTQMENELLRERGLWGPPFGSWLDKWMLDMVEGPFRMRKKMVKNDLFYLHYPYRPDMEDSPLKYKVAMSHDSKEYYERFRSQTLVESGTEMLPIKIGIDNDINQSDTETEERSPEDIFNMPKLLRKSVKSTDEEDLDEPSTGESINEGDTQSEQCDTSQETQSSKTDNNQTILRILGEGEKITNIFRCGRIQGLDTAEGLLLFGREHFYVIDGFTMLRTREIRDIDSLPPDLHDPIIPKASHGGGTQRKLSSKFLYEDIKEVHKRRYLLQPIAVEVFSADGRNYLLAFPRKLRNKVYAKFLSVATAMTDAQQSLSGQKHSTKVEAGSGLISTLIGEKSVTQRWERGEINNFQYLMYLNTLAGRSYNDLMQYPVFPWIIADYDIEELDLSNSSTFRDLSKPMGAQTENRLKQFKKRYHDWDDPQGETPPYHYGTHYSSAMIVASYLVRMEPFTQHFLKLQGGHFDLADRMFHSVKENWLSASKNNMADVKELIPEFFYLPEFLGNANHFDLGAKQSGIELNNVVLPPWAKDDPREFIRAHREALECDYVSAHLHEWIDLIFGYKQQGQPAVDAVNVFHHLFYEGNVDIYNIDDPLKKNATIGFINNFGQIPKQMFKKPHPQKRLNIRNIDPVSMGQAPPTSNDKLFFHNVDNLKPTKTTVKELKSAVGQIIHNEKYILAVEQNKVLMPPVYNKYLAWGFADLSVRIGNYESDKATNVFECLDNGEILCAACPNSKIFITGGTSCVVNVWENRPKEKKIILKQPLYGHNETVTCLASSQPYNIIVSGSRDKTCIIWDLSRLVYVRQLRGHAAPVAAVCINELTGDIATCAGTYLYIWSINGEEIACVNTATSRNQQILCLAMSQIMEWDNKNVVLTGNSDGVVRMWSIEYVQVPVENKTKEVEDAARGEETPTVEDLNKLTKSNSMDIPKLARRDSYSEAKAAVDRLKDCVNFDLGDVEVASSVDSESYFTPQARQSEGRASGDFKCNIEREESMLSTISSISDVGYRDDGFSTEGDQKFEEKIPSDKNSVKSVDLATEALEVMIGSNISETQIPCQSEPCLSAVTSSATISGCDRSQSNPDLKIGSEKDSDIESPESPVSDFVVINEKEAKSSAKGLEDLAQKYRPKNRNALREGFRWQRMLVFRSKLTMHTAYERKDNKDPAAVTAIAVSKDHKTVYVGDARGRIFSWTVTDQPGRVVADHWIKDDGADFCLSCRTKFSFSERRHHCRNCGKVFCSKCSRYETEIRRLRILKPVRVCQACYNILKAQQAADAIAQNRA